MKRILSKKISFLISLLPIGAIVLFSIHPLYSINQDIGRHLKIGEIIWETGKIPATNLFSFTATDYPFINHHWLSEVIFYLLETIIGLQGLIIFKALIIGFAFFFAWRGSSLLFGKKAATLALILAFPIFSSRTDLRPEIFSFLFLGLSLYLIAKYIKEKRIKYLIFLLPIQVIWTNTHIYFPLLIGTLVILALAFIKEKQISSRLFVFSILCALATLINPSGLKGALEPLTILSDYGYPIAENQSVFFLLKLEVLINEVMKYQYILFVYVLTTLSYIFKERKVPGFNLLLGIPYLILATLMIRNFAPLALILVMALAQVLQVWVREIKVTRLKSTFWSGIWILIFGLIIWGPGQIAFGQNNEFGLDIPAGSQAAVDYVIKSDLRGPMFNNFDVGSFLIWKLYPREKVFVDGRPEAYPSSFFREIYIPMQEQPEIWDKYSKQFNIQYILFDKYDATPWAQTFIYLMRQNKDWPIAYEDSRSIIFVKK